MKRTFHHAQALVTVAVRVAHIKEQPIRQLPELLVHFVEGQRYTWCVWAALAQLGRLSGESADALGPGQGLLGCKLVVITIVTALLVRRKGRPEMGLSRRGSFLWGFDAKPRGCARFYR